MSRDQGYGKRCSWSYERRYGFAARVHLSDADSGMVFFFLSSALSVGVALTIIFAVGSLWTPSSTGGPGSVLAEPSAISIFVIALFLGPFAMLVILEKLERCKECRKLGQKTPMDMETSLCSFHDWMINQAEKTWPSYILERRFVSVPEGEEPPLTLLMGFQPK